MPKGSGARKSKMLGKAIETDIATIEDKQATNTESGNAVNMELQPNEKMVSLTIKVPASHRQHWQIEAKKQNTNVTRKIIEALTNDFGLPS